jgi:hypothetical protein
MPLQFVQMADELKCLGGGDIRVGQAAVTCSVWRPQVPHQSIVTALGTSGISLLDPRAGTDTPTDQNTQLFDLPACDTNSDKFASTFGEVGHSDTLHHTTTVRVHLPSTAILV